MTDARDWYIDYFNGVFFQQDPPGTGDHSDNPDHVQGYLYVGKYLSASLADAGGGGGGGAPQMRSAMGGSTLPGSTEAYAIDNMPVTPQGDSIESFNYDVNSRMAGGNKG